VISKVKKPALVATAVFGMICACQAQTDPESRIIEYIRSHLRAGEPVVVTDLYNTVFTKPQERKVLDKLFNAFFRIPQFVAQYQEQFGHPPSLKVIAEQFDLRNRQAADVLVQVMESDPRVPHFFSRDPKSGEIIKVDQRKILSDSRFGSASQHQLGGWEGRPAPAFRLEKLAGGVLDSAALGGKVVLLYVWFTGCPPCMKETPELVALAREFSNRNFSVVGANADRLLGLDYNDAVRQRYAEENKIDFPLVHWTGDSDSAYGGITIYPTIFLIGRKGDIARQWIGFVSRQEIRAAIVKTLEVPARDQ
jgi:thiol-disulfide isomerase/thioredoxin